MPYVTLLPLSSIIHLLIEYLSRSLYFSKLNANLSSLLTSYIDRYNEFTKVLYEPEEY